MDPRMPLNQRNSPPISNNSHPSYMQPQMNKFGTNDQSPHTQQPLRPPNFQTSTRMGRNVATVGPLTGKIHQVEGVGDYPAESIVAMPNQVMPPNMNVAGDSLPGAYNRGPNIYHHPAPSMMGPNSNLRESHISPQQSMYSQLPGQMSMDMLPQQRFQSSLPPPMSASRFPSGQHLPDSAMMTPMPMSDGLSMPPMSNTSFYDNTFAVKPGPGGPGVPRPLPPQMQPQQPPFPPHHPLISPVSIQQPQSNSAMPMRALDASDSTPRQPPPRQPPPQMGMQQHQVPQTLPHTNQRPRPPPIGPVVPPLPPPSFPVPAQGTLCVICSRDLTEPPAPLSAKVESGNYQPPPPAPPVQCEAGCHGWFHLYCSGLTLEAFYLLKSEGPLVEWICTPCANQAHPNIPYIRLRH